MKHLLFGLLLTFAVSSSQAQNTELDRSRLNTAAYYNYSDPGDVTLQDHVWGAMRFPGLYEVPRETRLSELISLAGGPQVPERARRSIRRVQLQLHRITDTTREVVMNVEMENQIVVSDADPVLQSGDVLSAESVVRQTFSIRDLFPIISAVATLALLIDRAS
jgi:hypothetical protein